MTKKTSTMQISGEFRRSIVLIFSFLIVSLILTIPSSIAATYNLTYDPNGNRLSGFGLAYEYNNFNQLSKVRLSNSSGIIIEEYLYDHEGQRILKKTRNESTFYINKNFIRVQNASGNFDTVYYYDGKDTLLARKDPDNKTYFYHPDHLGSTTLVTNSTGQVVEETNYYPYGLPLYDAQSRFLYTGKELDKGTNLQYFGARFYDPELARFIQPDSTLPNPYDPQQLNRYSYTKNNPYRYIDPSGNYIESAIDIASLAYDFAQYQQDPSLLNTVALVADVATLLLPGAAAGGFLVKGGAAAVDALSAANKGTDAVKGLDAVTSGARGTENVPDVLKSQDAFERAIQDAVNKANPGTPTDIFAGTRAHSQVGKSLEQQGVPGEFIEQSRIGGGPAYRGQSGSSRADTIFQQGNDITVYDYKFGKGTISNQQLQNYIINFDPKVSGGSGTLTIKIVKPFQSIKTVKRI